LTSSILPVLKKNNFNFDATHATLQRYVDANILSGVSSAVLVRGDLVDLHCTGFADIEQKVALRSDHLFRAFSNTKLVTSTAIMLLIEEGLLNLDDAIETFIPALGARRVLKPGAASITDTEPAKSSITIRHLLSHSSGLSYGLFDPGTIIFNAYSAAKVLSPQTTLEELIEILAPLPLVFHPGTSWEYSIATDVLSRLVEVISGSAFDRFIQARIFTPLGMGDTGFVVPPQQQERLASYYAGADLLDPMKPGLTKLDRSPWSGAYLSPVPRLSGGGGLVTSLPDMIAFMRSFLQQGQALLKAETIAQMMQNQLPNGVRIGFAGLGRFDGKGFGLGGAVTLSCSPVDPQGSEGEFEWGGIAGTHWWMSPKKNIAGILMTQRRMSFWHPYALDFKREVYRAVLA
jgi:CubicO group peptidase (beta-lactamase class C family)